MMKHKFIFITALVGIFMAVNGFAYDGTGMWNFEEHSAYNDCGFTYTPETGEVGILQTGSTFLIVGDDFSTEGNVTGNTYTYSDTFCEEDGYVILNATITLTSATSGTGTVSWTYYSGVSCQGGHQLTLNKQFQAAPVYNASGKWNFTQSGFSHTCDTATTPRPSGYFSVNQSGNKVTAVDDQAKQYSGYVNGAEYALACTKLESGARTTNCYLVNLSSETQGSGDAKFVWDDDCDDCDGEWDIFVNKAQITVIPGVAPLLLNDE